MVLLFTKILFFAPRTPQNNAFGGLDWVLMNTWFSVCLCLPIIGIFSNYTNKRLEDCQPMLCHARADYNDWKVSVVGEGGRVNSKGVVLESGEVLEADAVVCNADLPYAEKALLPDTVSRSFEVRPGVRARLEGDGADGEEVLKFFCLVCLPVFVRCCYSVYS